MARTRRKRKATDLQPGAAPESVPGQLELFSLEPEATDEQPAASVVQIDERATTPKTEGNEAA